MANNVKMNGVAYGLEFRKIVINFQFQIISY